MKRYSRDSRVRKALKDCLHYLPCEKDPGRMGDSKSGRYKGTYGYNLSGSLRLIYKVDYENHRIILLAMGDHKEVYLRD